MKDLLLAYYGDDFTGSTDSMEVLAMNGLNTVLFLQMPDLEYVNRAFPDVECIGIAGVTRAMDRARIIHELPPVLRLLKELPATVVHYKVCSTFDSSPEIGSIGLAIDLARETFKPQSTIPLVVGVPALRRYTVFGNHFASEKGKTYRLDRHPTMSKHPVTPMDESDLRVLLTRQTTSIVAHMDLCDLDGGFEQVRKTFQSTLAEHPEVLLFDVLDEARLKRTGQLIWENATAGNRFVVGSSGVEYGLTSYWNEQKMISNAGTLWGEADRAESIVVLSGSCSPVTERQILFAIENGFQGIRLPVAVLLRQDFAAQEVWAEIVERASGFLARGQSLIFYSSLGPGDPSIQLVRRIHSELGPLTGNLNEHIGRLLGRLGRELIERFGVRRLVVAGGDTSGYAVSELHIHALRMYRPIEPGGPLCVAYSENPSMGQLQIALKGGQVGSEQYFLNVLNGRANVNTV